MTIRTRLTFLYASLLAIVILMFSAATSAVLNWTLRNQVDNTLIEAIEVVRREVAFSIGNSSDGTLHFGDLSMLEVNNLSTPGLFFQVWLTDPQSKRSYLYDSSWNLLGFGYAESLDARALDETHEIRRDVVVDDNHLRVATAPLIINGRLYGHIQTASSLRTVDAAIDRLLKIMLIGGAVILLASLLLGDFLTRRALQPIDTIAQAAAQITAADDLSRRIPYNGPPDELAQLTNTFNETMERLERLFNAQRRFVADVSHEMRTPLTTIQGNLDLIRRIGYDEEALEAIESEAGRMSRLVGDLLLLAKADAGRLSLEKTNVDLDTLVLEVYNQAHLLSEGVDVQLGNLDRAQVLGDPDRLKQLLLNLVSNGLKYTPAGGSVTIDMTRDERTVKIAVSDTGIGIPEEDLPHIFDRFYRVDRARSRAQGGTGLGLSIAKWIADAHGGCLTVTSQLGQGSTFTISLPVVPDHAPKDSIRATIPSLPAIRLPRSR